MRESHALDTFHHSSTHLLSYRPPLLASPDPCRLDMGLNGAGYAILVEGCVSLVLVSIYRLWRDYRLQGSEQQTWGGVDAVATLRGIPAYLALGVPSVAMICIEWWVWEVIVILAGTLPDGATATGVMGLALQVRVSFRSNQREESVASTVTRAASSHVPACVSFKQPAFLPFSLLVRRSL
jgi:hypothetical protein